MFKLVESDTHFDIDVPAPVIHPGSHQNHGLEPLRYYKKFRIPVPWAGKFWALV
ncbi:predicted protein [Botrytis cinerea T4]|uniref:Uncharacterized protein n=1 Tax=Botryotinia fuckeliana (strain T4) TaxID=999810 RepID=G2Y3E3_BOTF4|nr:predicted protein [Botrytis cinerea T4]